MVTFIGITLGSALLLHLVLFGATKLFGKGGEGTLGDIRTAIGSSLPTPLGVAIWVIALTLTSQTLVEHFAWSPIELESTEGESVITNPHGIARSHCDVVYCTGHSCIF
jgi:hypothetical protein